MTCTIAESLLRNIPLGSAGEWWDKNWLAVAILVLVLVAIVVAAVLIYMKVRPPASTAAAATDGDTRSTLARNVVIFATTGVVLLALTVLVTSGWNLESTKFVFASILPLLGTWVGTILAYYFARENLAAATESVSTFADRLAPMDRDDKISVQDRMRKVNDIQTIPVRIGQENTVTLRTLADKGVPRIVITDPDRKDVLRFLIYKSVVDSYRSRPASFPEGRTLDTVTLRDLLTDDNTKMFKESWAVVGPQATMGDARRKMASQGEKCNDVFVTTAGGREDAILGWLTDNKLNANPRGN